MRLLPAKTLPAGDDWIYEIKWDGFRVVGVKNRDRVCLWSRNGVDLTKRFTAIASAMADLPAKTAVIDGEAIAIDETGRPSFDSLTDNNRAAAFVAYDLLHLDGRDLLTACLEERKKSLRRLLLGQSILFSEPMPGPPESLLERAREMNLEGIVAKRLSSMYRSGASHRDWIKVKFRRVQEFVIGGYIPGRSMPWTVLVGYYDGDAFRFAGKVDVRSTRDHAVLTSVLPMVDCEASPFGRLFGPKRSRFNEGITAADLRYARWVTPRIVVDVAFAEISRRGILRQPTFHRFRTDKDAREVTLEVECP